MKKEPILSKIRTAKQELTEAEANLASVLRELEVFARADKSTIGKALEEAFAKVKVASTNLVDLEKLIANAQG